MVTVVEVKEWDAFVRVSGFWEVVGSLVCGYVQFSFRNFSEIRVYSSELFF